MFLVRQLPFQQRQKEKKGTSLIVSYTKKGLSVATDKVKLIRVKEDYIRREVFPYVLHYKTACNDQISDQYSRKEGLAISQLLYKITILCNMYVFIYSLIIYNTA